MYIFEVVQNMPSEECVYSENYSRLNYACRQTLAFGAMATNYVHNYMPDKSPFSVDVSLLSLFILSRIVYKKADKQGKANFELPEEVAIKSKRTQKIYM